LTRSTVMQVIDFTQLSNWYGTCRVRAAREAVREQRSCDGVRQADASRLGAAAVAHKPS